MLEFVIVGGGIHGTYISNVLVNELGWSVEDVKVIDPHATACGRWKALTARTGMEFLRSPIGHHLGVTRGDLKSYQRAHTGETWASTFGPTERPSLELFNRHIDNLCDQSGLSGLRVQGEATAILKKRKGLVVRTSAGDFKTRRVILAISSNDKLLVPDWAAQIQPVAKHVFQSDFTLDSIRPGERQLVVGAGITAAQVALHACSVTPGKVRLLTRRPLKIAELDSEQCWLEPTCLSIFAEEKDYTRRRDLIKSARNKGTVTPEVYRAIRRAELQGKLEVVVAEVDSARHTVSGQVTLLDAYNNHLGLASNVILSTGFAPGRPGGKLVDQVIAEFGMPLAGDGFPVVDSDLHWKDGIYVTGALAELEVGPPARNILGAQLAANRLRRALHPLAGTFVARSSASRL
jgi:hypothetical protein